MMWLALFRKWWPLVVLILCAAALWAIHTYDRAQYDRLGAEFATYRMQVAEANTQAQKAAREALEKQIRERAQIDKHNAEVMATYVAQTAALTADRDRARELARRLLKAGQARTPAPSRGVSETDHRSGASEAGQDAGDELADRVARVAAECRLNALQLDSLVAEIGRQL